MTQPATPRGDAVGTGSLDRQVGHGRMRRRTVPVHLTGLGMHRVPGADLGHGSSLALHPASALGDMQHLPERVGMPGGAGAGGEAHAHRSQPG